MRKFDIELISPIKMTQLRQVSLDGIEYQYGEPVHLQLDYHILRGEGCLDLVKFLRLGFALPLIIMVLEKEYPIWVKVSGDWQGHDCRKDCLQVL